MARNRWRGDALAVAQVSRVQVTAAGSAGDTVAVTINRKTVTYTVQGGDTAELVAAGLVALLAASTIDEFLEVVWTQSTSYVVGTAATAGVPFTFTAGVTGGATVGSVSTPTASAGPNHWDTAANWSLNAVPVSTNDVDISNNSVDILYGLAQSAVTLASLNVDSTYTGRIGLPDWTGAYNEYRDTYLAVGATVLNVGAGQGGGSGRIRVDLGTVQTTALIQSSSSGSDQGVPAVFLKGTHASNVVTVSGGEVGLAFDPGASMTVVTLGVSVADGTRVPPNVQAGAGLTLTTLNQQGGAVCLQAGLTTANVDAGTLTIGGPATCNVTTANVFGGTYNHDAPGTIGTLKVRGGTADFDRDPRAKTVSACSAGYGSTVNDRYKHVTFSAGIALPDGPAGVNLNLGKDWTLTRS